MTAAEIKFFLQTHLPDAEISIDSPDNVHFTAVIVSDCFKGLSRVARQQKVYALLGEHLTKGAIHAFSFKALTQEERN